MIKKLQIAAFLLMRCWRENIPLLGPRLMRLAYGLPSVDLASLVPGNVQIGPPILDDICLPPYHGPKNHDDFQPLMMIVKSLCPHVVVELGTAHGNTVANLCRECPTTRVYTVNALAGAQTGILTTYDLALEDIGRVYQAYGFADRVVQLLENTLDLDLSKVLDGPIVDAAIIDACHDTDYVLNDFAKVRPFVRQQGVVLFHDTHPSMKQHLLGSYRACMMLRREGYDIRHIKDTWWAIWINSGPLPASGGRLAIRDTE